MSIPATLDQLAAVAGRDPAGLEDLLQEANPDRNRLMVSVFRPVRGEVGVRRRRTHHDAFPVTPQTPFLARADQLRMLAGKPAVYLAEALKRRGLSLAVAPNLRTNVGADFAAQQFAGTSVAVADVIALSANATAPAATMSSTTAPWSSAQATDGTTGEFTALGLARASATYAHSATGPASATLTYTLSKTFTATATATNVRLAGNFGGSAKASQGGTDTSNILFLVSSFTAQTLANGDQLVLTWTISTN